MRAHCVALLFALIGTIAGGHRSRQPQTGAIVPASAMVISHVGRYGRIPVHEDAVEAQVVAGTWKAPHAGDTVTLPDGKVRTWTLVNAGKNGSFTAPGLGSGYADIEVDSASDRVMILNASHYGMVYVNGQPRVGDPYGNGYLHLPVHLRTGPNDFLFATAGGRNPGRRWRWKTPRRAKRVVCGSAPSVTALAVWIPMCPKSVRSPFARSASACRHRHRTRDLRYR